MAMTLRLTSEQETLLEELAQQQGLSKQEATARAIEQAHARLIHQNKVAEASEKARKRWSDVLDRLGQ